MKKILAIDDKKDNLTTIEAVIKSNLPRCYVITAISGKEGIKLAREEQPDTILLDIIMPEMDGYETCRRLKTDELTKHIPVILITAIRTDSKSIVKGLDIGADAFLSKPIDTYELIAQLNVMLRIKKAEDKLRDENVRLDELVENKIKEIKYQATVLENISEAVISTDLDFIIKSWNDSAEEIYDWKVNEVIDKKFVDVLKPIYLQNSLEDIVKNVFEKRNFQGEVIHRKKDGSVITVQSTSSLIRDTEGIPIGFVSVNKDITEKKVLEEKVNESNINTRFLYDSLIKLTNLKTSDEVLLFAGEQLNKFTDAIVGVNTFDSESMKSKVVNYIGIKDNIKDVLKIFGRDPIGMETPMDKPKYERLIAGKSAGKLKKIEGGLYEIAAKVIPELICKQLEKLLGIGNIYQIGFIKDDILLGAATLLFKENSFPGNIDIIETFIRQISLVLGKKIDEEKIKLFNDLINNSGDAVFVIDPENGRFLDVNSVACENLLYTRKEMLQMNVMDIEAAIPKNFQWNDQIKMIKEKIYSISDGLHKRKDNTVFPVEAARRYITLNKKDYLLVNIRDVTIRKKLEQELLDSVVSTQETERKRFARDMHDGLGPLLSGIKMYISSLLATNHSLDKRSEFLKKTDELLKDAISNVVSIANDIAPAVLENFGLRKALEKFCNTINDSETIEISFISNDLSGLPKNLEVTLYRIITELINNSCKHSQAKEIKVKVKHDNENLYVNYSDDGIGFDIDEVLLSDNGRNGLKNIISRCKSIFAVYDLNSSKGNGFRCDIVKSLKN